MKRYLLSLLLVLLTLPSYAHAGGRGEIIQLLLDGLRDSSGQPLNGGKVYTYAAGTTTNKDTYTDAQDTTAGANPIILDSNGVAQRYADGAYKFVVKDSADVTLYTWDNLNFSYDKVDTLYAVTAGSGTAYTASISPAPGAYYTGMTLFLKAHAVSGASPTLNINGLGAKNLKKRGGSAVIGGDIFANQLLHVTYDGTNFIIVDGLVSDGTDTYGGTSSGAANVYAFTIPITTGAYRAEMIVTFLAHQTNTGAATANMNGLGSVDIKRADGSALTGGEIQINQYVTLIYNGSGANFRLLEPAAIGWSSYTPTLSQSGSLTLSSTSILVARYLRIGKIVNVQIGFSGTLGGTASTDLRFTLPFTSVNAGGTKWAHALINNGGTFLAGHIQIPANSAYAACRMGDVGNFTNSGTGECYSNFFYEAP